MAEQGADEPVVPKDPVVAAIEAVASALWAQRSQLEAIADALTVLASPPRGTVHLENMLEESARLAAQDRLTERSNGLNSSTEAMR